MQKLIEENFMGPSVWEMINARIAEWAERLAKTAEANEEKMLSSLLRGRSPVWWLYCLSNGFTGGRVEGGVHIAESQEVGEMRKMIEGIQDAYSPASAVEIIVDMAEIAGGKVIIRRV